MAELHLKGPDGDSRSATIVDRPTRVGRSSTNELICSDPRVSSFHLAVWQSQGRILVEDLGSKNGTELNGEAVTGTVAVQDGDCLVLGGTVQLRIAGEAAPVRFLNLASLAGMRLVPSMVP